MKQFWREVGLAVVLGMLMPGIILNIVTFSAQRHFTHAKEPVSTQPIGDEGTPIMVLISEDATLEMDLEEYLLGVILAEMPASFELEALKAQAVVARTYTLRANEGKSKHVGAAVCTDSACCQAYCSETDYLASGGSQENVDKIRSAVTETADLVLTYGGELIEATYFSCSGGATEDALAVWGADVPYLRSVASPGEEHAAYYSDSVEFSFNELKQLLDLPSRESEFYYEDVILTAGGGVAQLRICGTLFQGTQLRYILGLRSTAFTVTIDDDMITFHTRGFGHRVGMSQYGADAMAVSGYDFRQILQHYYQGTQLVNRSIDKTESVG